MPKSNRAMLSSGLAYSGCSPMMQTGIGASALSNLARVRYYVRTVIQPTI
jgi:hypothetical protein